MAWLNQWEDDGFAPVIKMWNQRIENDKVIEMSNGSFAKLLTIDENGVAVVEKIMKKFFYH